MGDLPIWTFVGCVSAINGLVCFALSSTYNMSFGKLGSGGHFVYLLVGLMMWCLIWRAKRIPVSGKVQGLVAALFFVVICLISVGYDQFVAGKSDALSIISYGSFALMSLSMSRKLELGFETGFSAFFLQLFAAQLFKINWILLPIALVFCSVIIMLRHRSESGEQSGSSRARGSNHSQGVSSNGTDMESGVTEVTSESQDSPGKGSMSDLDSEQNKGEEEDTSSFVAESGGQSGGHSRGQSGGQSGSVALIFGVSPPGELRRRTWRKKPEIREIRSLVGGTHRRWPR